MSYLAALFFCLGAADFLMGNRFGIGQAFREGLDAIVELLFLMTGFIALAPWINDVTAPVIAPLFESVGCDPSLFAGMLLSCDSGAAVLAQSMAADPTAGLYNGMIVGAFLGITIMITIPLVLENAKGSKKAAVVKGLLVGFVTLPFGCVLTGVLAGFPIALILRNTWPVLVLSLILLLLFRVCQDKVLVIFQVLSLIIRSIALAGFAISVVQETLGVTILHNLTPLSEIFPVICNIGVFLAGILPFMAVLRRILTKPLQKLGQALQINQDSVIGFFICAANPIPVMIGCDKLDDRGCTLNVAFLTAACFAAGDFLAFSMQFAPQLAVPLMIGKLLTGIGSLCAALLIMRPASVREPEMQRGMEHGNAV